MKMAARAALVSVAVLTSHALMTEAFTTGLGKWSHRPVLFYANPQNGDVSAAAAEAALVAGMNAWGTQGGANFEFAYGGRVSDTSIGNDGRNVAIFRNESNGSAIATAYTWRMNGTLVDADIIFWDGAFTFVTGTGACSGAAFIEDIATHEFGHALGLGHSTDPTATMTPSYSWCSREFRTLAADDIAGVQALYGASTPVNAPPTVAIALPAPGATFVAGSPVTFSGSAQDAQDGLLSAALQWTSSVDGVLGSGASFTTTLSAGSHVITARVTDSGGLSGSASVTVTVTAPSSGTGASATFVRVDAQTSGSWRGVYGARGYQVAGDTSSLPAYVTVTRPGASFWTWAYATSDVRAPQRADGSGRVAATWYGNFDTRVTLADASTRRIALYVVDFDTHARRQTIQVIDAATSTLLDQRTITSFHGGQYVVWDVKGDVILRMSVDAGANAVQSALFFDDAGPAVPPPPPPPPPSSPSSATFVSLDAQTSGSWRGVYGARGYEVAGDTSSLPAYVTVTRPGASFWTWAYATSDARAPQRADGSGRVAATWYGNFDTRVTLADASTRRIALYVVDFDTHARRQTIQVIDAATSTLLDQRTITSFHGGQYVVWDVKGDVILRMSVDAGANAVQSALFFDDAPGSALSGSPEVSGE